MWLQDKVCLCHRMIPVQSTRGEARRGEGLFSLAILACRQYNKSFTFNNSKFTLEKRLHQREIALESLPLATGEQQADGRRGLVPIPCCLVFCGFGTVKVGSICEPFGSQMDLGACYFC